MHHDSIGTRNGLTTKTPPKKVAALLQEYVQSGMTQREFARQNAIGFSTLRRWLSQARRNSQATTPWVEVEMDGIARTEIAGYQIEIGERRLTIPAGFDLKEVQQLVELLAYLP